MAETTQSCLGDPNFAVVCFYLQKFGLHLGLPDLNVQQLKSSIEDRKLGNNVLRDLHLSLLRKLGRKSINSGRWERSVEQFAISCCCVDYWYLTQHGYWNLKLSDKVVILKNLLEAQFDSNTKFKEKLNEISADDLRQQPIGYDSTGLAYWFLVDSDLNINVFRGEQDDGDGETWQVVTRERNDLVELIESLKKCCTSPVGPVAPLPSSDDVKHGDIEAAVQSSNIPNLSQLKDGAAAEDAKSSSGALEEIVPGQKNKMDTSEAAACAVPIKEEESVCETAVPVIGAPSDSLEIAVKQEEYSDVHATTDKDASEAASDCSSDNVPLSQVRKSCRLLSRARAAIAEVKKKRDRDKLKMPKRQKKSEKSPRQKSRKKHPENPRDSESSEGAADFSHDEVDAVESNDSEHSSDVDYIPHGRNAQRAARRKAATNASAAGTATSAECVVNDDTPCTCCGKYTHPDLILLCDRCNAGYHTGCLRPPLFFIPDGDWFCPNCEHYKLITKLEAALIDYDAKMKIKQRAVKRQERMTNSGISLDNIILSHQERPKRERVSKRSRNDDYEYGAEDDLYGTAESTNVCPTVKRSCRTRGKVSYRYEEYDELIKTAVADGCAPRGTGTTAEHITDAAGQCSDDIQRSYGRKAGGKDMATIMLASQASRCDTSLPTHPPVSRGKDMSTIMGQLDDTDEDDGSRSEQGSVTSEEKQKPVLVSSARKKKSRKLTGLDESSSEGDDVSDEYKATEDEYDEEDDDAEEQVESYASDANSDSSSRSSWYGSRRAKLRSATRSQPARASKLPSRRYAALAEDDSESEPGSTTWSCTRNLRARRQATRRVRVAESDEDDECATVSPSCSDESYGTHLQDRKKKDSRVINKRNKRAAPATQSKRRRAVLESEEELSAGEDKTRFEELGKCKSTSSYSNESDNNTQTVINEGASETNKDVGLCAAENANLPVDDSHMSYKLGNGSLSQQCGGGTVHDSDSSESGSAASASRIKSSACSPLDRGSERELSPAMKVTEHMTIDRPFATTVEGPVLGSVTGTSATAPESIDTPKDGSFSCGGVSRESLHSAMSLNEGSNGRGASLSGVVIVNDAPSKHPDQSGVVGTAEASSCSTDAGNSKVLEAQSPAFIRSVAQIPQNDTRDSALPSGIKKSKASAKKQAPLAKISKKSKPKKPEPESSESRGLPEEQDQSLVMRGYDTGQTFRPHHGYTAAKDDHHQGANEESQNLKFTGSDIPDGKSSGMEPHAYMGGPRAAPAHLQHQQAYPHMNSRHPMPAHPGYYGQPLYGSYAGSSGPPLPGYSAPLLGVSYMHGFYPGQPSATGPPPAYGTSLSSYGAVYAPQQQRYSAMTGKGPLDASPSSQQCHQPAAPQRTASDRSQNSHNASFMMDNILQSPQKTGEENEDELSNILDIVSYVTGAPVGDDRTHKS